MAVIGYNCGKVEDLARVINSVAQKSGKNIIDRLHSEIIVPMSKIWYAPEAQEFFEKFAEVVQSTSENIQLAYDAFRKSVQAAGENWAENSGGQKPELAAVEPIDLTLNTTAILAHDGGGNVSIDEEPANRLAASLSDVQQNIMTDLKSAAEELDASTAFVGGAQAEALQQCFSEVSQSISKIFNYLTEGEFNLQSQIDAAVKKYGEVASGISSEFSSSSSSN